MSAATLEAMAAATLEPLLVLGFSLERLYAIRRPLEVRITELNILSRVKQKILRPCLASLSYMAAGTAAGRVTSFLRHFYVILLK